MKIKKTLAALALSLACGVLASNAAAADLKQLAEQLVNLTVKEQTAPRSNESRPATADAAKARRDLAKARRAERRELKRERLERIKARKAQKRAQKALRAHKRHAERARTQCDSCHLESAPQG